MKEIIIKNPRKDEPENIFTDSVLKELESVGKNIIKLKNEYKTVDFDFIERMLICYIKNNKFVGIKRISKPLKKGEVISYTLDYYKSIDIELYERIRDIIFNKNPKIRMNIYDISKVKDFREKDFEFKEFERYSSQAENYFKANKDMIYIPLNSCNSSIQRCNEATTDNLYILVHELAHTFDGNMEEIIDKNNRFINQNYEAQFLLTESIARAFETNLTSFLLDNKIIRTQNEVLFNISMVNDYTNYKSLVVCIELALAKMIERKEKINAEEVNKIFDSLSDFTPDGKRRYIEFITDSLKKGRKHEETDLYVDMRYAISGMISPTIIEFIKQGRIDDLKDFFELSKKGYFGKSLEKLEIPLNEEGIKILEQNMLKNQINIKSEEEHDR